MNPAGANIEIRPATAAEMADLKRVDDYAFAENALPPDPPEPHPLSPEQTLCAYDGARMVATSGAFDFRMRLNGRPVPADGVTVVACDPGYRRRGIVRALITGLLERSHERGVPLSILWASMGAIYQRFGYGPATTNVAYDIPLRDVAFQFGEPPSGFVRLVDTDQAAPVLDSVYRAYGRDGNGLLHRGALFWQLMLRRTENQHTHVAVYYDADGAPRGYCLYRTRWDGPGPDPDQLIEVFDFIWLDMDAYRGLWLYLAGHDLAKRIRMTFMAEDDPAPYLLLEPRALHRRTWDGVWLRVVDAKAALAGRGYDVAGEAVVEVVGDDLCPWNTGRYRLVAAGGECQVDRLGQVSAAPDIVASPWALAALVSGHARPSELDRAGRLQITDGGRWAELDTLFATRRRPHTPNMF